MCAFSPATIPSAGFEQPSQWTVDDSGGLVITQTSDDFGLSIIQAAGAVAAAIQAKDNSNHTFFRAGPTSAVTGGTTALPAMITVQTTGVKLWGDPNNDSNFVIHVKSGDKLGFFGTAPVAKPNVGAVPTALSIATALVALGLVDSS